MRGEKSIRPELKGNGVGERMHAHYLNVACWMITGAEVENCQAETLNPHGRYELEGK